MVCWGAEVGTGQGDSWELKTKQHPIELKEKAYSKLKTEGKIALSGEIKKHMLRYVWNKLYKTEILRKNKITFTEKQLYEDIPFTLKYLAWARTGFFIKEPFYHYRAARPGSIVTEHRKIPVSSLFLSVFEDIHDYYRRFGLLEENRALLSEILALMVQHDLDYSTDYHAFLDMAGAFVARYHDLPDSKAKTFNYLKKRASFIRILPLSPLEKIISLTNVRNKKVFRILGMEFAMERNQKKKI